MAREDLIRLTPSANGSDGLDAPPCGKDDCPNVYRTASGSFVVQGAVSGAFDAPEGESLVEIPEETLREAVRALGW